MNPFSTDVEPMVYESGINVPYSWWAGETAGRFFEGLRDEGIIRGTRCVSCGRVHVPPRKSCPKCFHSGTEWVELSGEGVLQTFTVVRRQLAAVRQPVPVVFGLIRLDGADTALLHRIGEVPADAVRIGMRVRVKFAETRCGNIQDIACFIPCP